MIAMVVDCGGSLLETIFNKDFIIVEEVVSGPKNLQN